MPEDSNIERQHVVDRFKAANTSLEKARVNKKGEREAQAEFDAAGVAYSELLKKEVMERHGMPYTEPSKGGVIEKDGNTAGKGRRNTRKSSRMVRIPMKHEGDLKNLGYSLGKSARSRHASLKKAVKRYGRLSTSRKLNALAVFNKRRHPLTARKARADRKFVMK